MGNLHTRVCTYVNTSRQWQDKYNTLKRKFDKVQAQCHALQEKQTQIRNAYTSLYKCTSTMYDHVRATKSMNTTERLVWHKIATLLHQIEATWSKHDDPRPPAVAQIQKKPSNFKSSPSQQRRSLLSLAVHQNWSQKTNKNTT